VTADEERARSINAAFPEAHLPQPWHGYGLLGQIVFFLLTLAGIVAFFAMTRAELLTSALCIALAEYLIRGRKWFGTGVEAALWIGGVFSAIAALPRSGAPEANLLIAAAAGLAGFRVRNPLFGALAAFFVTRYLEVKADLGTIGALLIAGFALMALCRTWKRPSTEWLFIVLLVTMPFGGWAHSDLRWRWITIALYAAFAMIAFALAVKVRHHWMFAGAAASAIVTAGLLQAGLGLKAELVLATGGSILLVGSLVTARRLRGRTTGFVMTPAALTAFDDDIQSVATVVMAPTHSAGNPPEGRPQGEGGFGGAGATGDY
jgi:hypothetical protein